MRGFFRTPTAALQPAGRAPGFAIGTLELDILVFAPDGKSAAEISERSRMIFEAAAERNLHLATSKYPSALLRPQWEGVEFDQPLVTCLMKPEHADWLDRIWQILDAATRAVLSRSMN